MDCLKSSWKVGAQAVEINILAPGLREHDIHKCLLTVKVPCRFESKTKKESREIIVGNKLLEPVLQCCLICTKMGMFVLY